MRRFPIVCTVSFCAAVVTWAYAVIDKSTLWYGGINFLGFEKAAHGAMRLCSAELAKELNDKINNEQEQMSLPEV